MLKHIKTRWPETRRRACRSFAAAGLALVFVIAGRADTIIDANSFTFTARKDPKTGLPYPNANDFHLTVGGNFVGDPSSDVFPNRSVNGGTADFKGQNLANGGSHNVKFKVTGDKPKPRGYFTLDGLQISDEVQSKALDGTTVAFIPSGGGWNATITVSNDFGSMLTGDLAVYVNNGYFAHFNLDEFDALRGPLLINQGHYALNQGEIYGMFNATLLSPDQYVLLLGTANAGDGAGPFPWALGFTPIDEVPEPGAALLAAAGLALFAALRRRKVN